MFEMKIKYTFCCCFVPFLLSAIKCKVVNNQTEIKEIIESDGANDTDHDTLQSKITLLELPPSDIKEEEGIF